MGKRGPRSRPIEERFWEKVDKSGDCWQWLSTILPNGFATFFVEYSAGKSRTDYAHRVVWQLTNGPIPDDALVMHSCDNRSCVNPDHLYLGTNQDRFAAMVQAGNGRRGKSKLTWDQTAQIRSLYATGNYNKGTLAEKFGVQLPTITRALNAGYESDPDKTKVTGKTAFSKLSKSDVEEIRNAHAAGWATMTELSRIYGVHLSTISLVINGKRRTDFPITEVN